MAVTPDGIFRDQVQAVGERIVLSFLKSSTSDPATVPTPQWNYDYVTVDNYVLTGLEVTKTIRPVPANSSMTVKVYLVALDDSEHLLATVTLPFNMLVGTKLGTDAGALTNGITSVLRGQRIRIKISLVAGSGAVVDPSCFIEAGFVRTEEMNFVAVA